MTQTTSPKTTDLFRAAHEALCAGRWSEARASLDLLGDHATGQFRGWVCPRCNTGLGYVEQPDWLAQARDYLRATR